MADDTAAAPAVQLVNITTRYGRVIACDTTGADLPPDLAAALARSVSIE